MADAIHRSFAGGEIAPSLLARADTVKYQTALRTCRNFIVQRFGGVTNRPGFQYICGTKSNGAARLIKFVFNASQTYVLEFGNLYMRVVKAGAQVTVSGTPYEIVTPYVTADLDNLQFVQSGDVVTITHPSYAPRELARTADDAWTLTAITFEPTISGPANCEATTGSTYTERTHRYKITAIDADSGEESLPGYGASKNISAATKADPVKITVTSHGFFTNDEVYISGIVGMTELNSRTFFITRVDSNNFTLNDEDGTAHTTYTSGGTAKRTHAAEQTSDSYPSSTNSVVVSWDTVTNASHYVVYREIGEGADYGYLATTRNNYYRDYGDRTPDQFDAPYEENNPFDGANDYPAAVTYSQNRLCFGGSNNNPEVVYLSKVGDYDFFLERSPLQDDDAFDFSCIGRQVNQIRHITEIGKMIVLTGGGEWVIEADGGVLAPDSVWPKQQSYAGASTVSPVVVNDTLLFVQARGSVIRDLRYKFESDGYSGQDLTIFAGHLFDGYTIARLDFQQIPHSVVWAVRSDGTLLGLTYLPEQEIWGWHRHDTYDSTGQSVIEDICVVPEGDEDVLYVVVKRTINGGTVRYIERMASRNISTVATDAKFADSFITYSGVATTTITGLDHLEGETVSVLGDGVVQAQKTISSGQITITSASNVIIGLPIQADLETLDLQNPAGSPIVQKQKRISEVTLLIDSSFSFKAGPDSSHLKTKTISTLTSDRAEVKLSSGWQTYGRVFIRQDDPLPLTILAVIPSVATGD